jgi:hypothetical protein
MIAAICSQVSPRAQKRFFDLPNSFWRKLTVAPSLRGATPPDSSLELLVSYFFSGKSAVEELVACKIQTVHMRAGNVNGS